MADIIVLLFAALLGSILPFALVSKRWLSWIVVIPASAMCLIGGAILVFDGHLIFGPIFIGLGIIYAFLRFLAKYANDDGALY